MPRKISLLLENAPTVNDGHVALTAVEDTFSRRGFADADHRDFTVQPHTVFPAMMCRSAIAWICHALCSAFQTGPFALGSTIRNVWLALLVCFYCGDAMGATSLDASMFPDFKLDGADAVVVAGNWATWDGDDPGPGKKAWIPARLFGRTDATASFKLEFSVTNASPRVSLRRRGGDDKQLTVTGTDNVVDAVVKSGQWNCEVFMLVGTQASPATEPAVVKVAGVAGGGADGFAVQLVLGEVWLIAGAANVGVQTELSAHKQVVAAQAGGVRKPGISVVFPPNLAAAKKIVPLSKDITAPAMGIAFAEALARRFDLTNNPSLTPPAPGVRPVCVYSWAQARQMIKDWKDPSTDAAWDGLGWIGAPKVLPTLPGMRGVVWWHGEWEVEYRNIATSEGYGIDLAKFRTEYAKSVVELRNAFATRLAIVDSPDSATDPKLAERTMWVTLQAPWAGRRTEFFDVHNAGGQPNPQSAWAELRAAQFIASDTLRKATWQGRPLAFAVPLDGPPGWNWGSSTNKPRDAALFVNAGEQIARGIAMAMLAPEQPDPLKFADGWPHIAGGGLRLPGVTDLGASGGGVGPGLRQPVLEKLENGTWSTIDMSQKKLDAGDLVVPLGTWQALRYGWSDAISGLHRRTLPVQGISESSPLPPFFFTP